MCAIDDGEPWEWFRESRPVGRKQYACYECGRTIYMGERHMYTVAKYDGRIDTYRICAHCDAASTWLRVACGGWLLGGLSEELREHWDEEWELRSVTLGRLILGQQTRWRTRTGVLMPLPDMAVVRASVPKAARA